METEIWKDIPGYECRYQASNLGRVKSLNFRKLGYEQVHKPQVDGWGYLRVTLCLKGKQKKISLHRVIALTFLGPSLLQVNHKDGNKQNNNIQNLEYCTGSDNVLHSFRKLGRIGTSTGKFGSLHHNSKKVFQRDKSYNVVGIYGSHMEAMRITGISNSHIGDCIAGRSKTAGGYIWTDK